MKNIKLISQLPLILSTFFMVSNARALDYHYSLFSTLNYSENLAQSTEPTPGSSLNTGINFDFNTDTNSSVQATANGSVAREIFSLDELEDQNTNNISASLLYKAPNINFQFLIRDDLSQTPRNRFSSQQVGNLANVNVLTLKPSYSFRMSSVQQINLEYTYAETDSETQGVAAEDDQLFDSINKRSSISFLRKINPTNDLSIVFEKSITDFAERAGLNVVDYEQLDTFLRWVGRGRFNQLQIEIGKSELTDEQDETYDNDLAFIIYSRQINREQSLDLSYRKGFLINQAQNFTNNTLDVDNQSSNFGNAQEFVTRTLSYNASGGLLTSQLSIFDQEFQSTSSNNTENRRGASLTLSYSLKRLLNTALESNVGLTLGYNDSNFTRQGVFFETSVKSASLRYTYAYSSKLSFFSELSLRDASDQLTPLTSALNRDANSLSIGISYSPTGNSKERARSL